MNRPRYLVLLTLLVSTFCHAQNLQISPVNADGIFPPGQPIAWKVTVVGDATKLGNPRYQIKRNGAEVIAEGKLDLTRKDIRIEAKPLTEPGTLLAEAITTDAANKSTTVLGGAVVEPDQIKTVVTRPADFDEFWKTQIAALGAVPANVIVEPGDSGREDVLYYKITMDNVDGKKIHAQLARPKAGTKFPAVVITQWAGVYPLQKSWVVGQASRGWLAIDVMAHDLPIDEPPAYYKNLSARALKDYARIGNTSRETSYFRTMFLGDLRAADYVAGRPDWDGKTLVANGGSQGGYQTMMLAALEPRVTAAVAEIPAGCELTSTANGRASGWPAWPLPADAKERQTIIETSRYFDTVNFASRVHVPTLVGMGLVDVTCPPVGVFSMYNQLAGPKEIVIFPTLGHKGPHSTYDARSGVWMKALVKGQAVPPKS